MKNTTLVSNLSAPLRGDVTIPGDKSISHRALIFAAIAEGVTRIEGFLNSADCLATLHALQSMGVKIEITGTSIKVNGVGKFGLKDPKKNIDCENSGTTMRVLAGILVGQSFATILTGDNSLMQRPMARILRPLKQMGADITANDDDYPPLNIKGGKPLVGIKYTMPIASAQVKTCVLMAGIYAGGETTLVDKGHTRDHTERMFTTFSYPILKSESELKVNAKGDFQACDIKVPGDISSAAFFIVAATLISGSELLIRDVGINPGRIGILKILNFMGASIEVLNKRLYGEEPVADLFVRSAKLEGIDIPVAMVPMALDEFPIIFIAAACATGQTLLHGAKELRYKESDRIKTMINGLRSLGIDAQELDDGVYIRGGKFSGGEVDACNDHRVAMAFSIAGLLSAEPVIIKNAAEYVTSFPNFINLAQKLRLNIRCV